MLRFETEQGPVSVWYWKPHLNAAHSSAKRHFGLDFLLYSLFASVQTSSEQKQSQPADISFLFWDQGGVGHALAAS